MPSILRLSPVAFRAPITRSFGASRTFCASASRAVGWGRVLDLIPPSEMEPWRAGASAWLGELLSVARELPDA